MVVSIKTLDAKTLLSKVVRIYPLYCLKKTVERKRETKPAVESDENNRGAGNKPVRAFRITTHNAIWD